MGIRWAWVQGCSSLFVTLGQIACLPCASGAGRWARGQSHAMGVNVQLVLRVRGRDGAGLALAPSRPLGPTQDPRGCCHCCLRTGDRCQVAIWVLQASSNRKRVENIAKRKLDSLIKESKIRDCEDPNNFTVSTLAPTERLGHKAAGKKVRALRLMGSA